MNPFVGILAGLGGMFGWGIADFLVAITTRKIGNFKTVFWMLITSFLFASLVFLVFPQNLAITPEILLLLVLLGLIQVVALLAFYRGFEVGLVSVVSPISSSYALIIVFVSLFFLKESLTNLQSLAVFLILLGIPLVSINLEELKKFKGNILQKGAKEGLITMFSWGILFLLIFSTVNRIGWFWPIYIFHFFAIVFLALYGLILHKEFRLGDLSIVKTIIPIGVLNTVGFFFVAFGFLKSFTSIVSAISAAYPLVTIILAGIFFKEKLFWNQILGIAGVIGGLVLLSI